MKAEKAVCISLIDCWAIVVGSTNHSRREKGNATQLLLNNKFLNADTTGKSGFIRCFVYKTKHSWREKKNATHTQLLFIVIHNELLNADKSLFS